MKKETKTKPTVLKKPVPIIHHIDTICQLAHGSKLQNELFLNAKPSLDVISDFFDLTDIQSVIFCVLLNINFVNESVDMNDFARFTGCSPITAFSLQKEVDALVNKQILKIFHQQRRRNQQRSKLCQVEYSVSDDVITKSVWGAEKFKPQSIQASKDIFDLMQALNEHFLSLLEEMCTMQEAFDDIHSLLSNNNHLQFVVDIKKEMLDKDSLILFLSCCVEYMDELSEINLAKVISGLYKTDLRKQMKVRQSILSNTNPLIVKGLITIDSGAFRSDSFASLSDRALNILIPDMDFTTRKTKQDRQQVVLATGSIIEKKLFFDADLQKQLDFLTDALQPANYNNLVARLTGVGMKTGIAILLHGEPGTGKTESAYQIARQTGRDLHVVSISDTKSKYFGESEKLITKTFKNYRSCVEKSKIAPILFINEADGVLGNRKIIGSSPVDQTENAIQNIILQEIEDLSGIMICTTNLITNLDLAFERRFLYKIRFEKPTIQAKQGIWMNKITSLTQAEARTLAEEFNFAGGAIENIARKYLMTAVLHGTEPDYKEIVEFCHQENLYINKQTKRIGYLP